MTESALTCGNRTNMPKIDFRHVEDQPNGFRVVSEFTPEFAVPRYKVYIRSYISFLLCGALSRV